MNINQYCLDVAGNFSKLTDISSVITSAAEAICVSLRSNNKVMFCGNGGSAADSQHLAAELMGRYLIDRRPLPAIALTTDTSAMTAIGNDYSYDEIFSRQVRGLAQKGDVLVGISTSGNSANVIHAINVARDLGVTTIGLTGERGGKMEDNCDIVIRVPSDKTNHIQEMHIAIGHMICGIVEEELCSGKS